jgi:hypothetical protein
MAASTSGNSAPHSNHAVSTRHIPAFVSHDVTVEVDAGSRDSAGMAGPPSREPGMRSRVRSPRRTTGLSSAPLHSASANGAPGTRTRASSPAPISPSPNISRPKREIAAPTLASSNPRCSKESRRNSTLSRPCARARSRAISSACPSWSQPTTAGHRRAAVRAGSPTPQPRSSSRARPDGSPS